MLSNEQCIEVAELVWGWDLEGELSLRHRFYDDENRRNTRWISPQELVQEVLSWSGFGKTVEAIINKKRGGYPDLHHAICCGMTDGDIAETIITATHLAALEAIKEQG